MRPAPAGVRHGPPRPAPAPRAFRRTPESSRGHAAVTKPGTVDEPLPAPGGATPRLRREANWKGDRPARTPALPPRKSESRPAWGPFRRHPRSLIDRREGGGRTAARANKSSERERGGEARAAGRPALDTDAPSRHRGRLSRSRTDGGRASLGSGSLDPPPSALAAFDGCHRPYNTRPRGHRLSPASRRSASPGKAGGRQDGQKKKEPVKKKKSTRASSSLSPC